MSHSLIPIFPDPPPPAAPSDPQLRMSALPDPDLECLDEEEAEIFSELTANPFAKMRMLVEEKFRQLSADLGSQVDCLSDGVHKLEQRVATAGRQADLVLGLAQVRLKEREERDRAAARTGKTPVMEVLRSLGRILPHEGGS